MTKRYSIAEQLLFDEVQWRILSEFDAFAESRPTETVERNVPDFQSFRGTELQFSEYSLRKWLVLRRRIAEA